MVRLALLLTACCALAAAPARAQSDGPGAAAELNDICLRDAGALWGVSLCGPLLVVNPMTRAVWASQADNIGALQPQGAGYAGTLPAGVGMANTAVDWGGTRWSMVLSPLPDDATERRVLLAHEAWHRIQPQLGFEARDSANAHLASERGRTLMRLEMRALATALRSSSVGQRRAIEDALILREARYQAFPNARGEEAMLDRNEGLANYTGVRLGAGAQATQYALRTLDAFDSHQALTRAYTTATGPAYGLLLDQQRPRWRSELGGGAPADLLRRPRVTPREISEASNRYGGPQVAAQERERAQAEAARIAGIRARFATAGRATVALDLAAPRFEFNPNLLTPIEGLGTYYETLTLRDGWGEARIAGGALVARNPGRLLLADPAPDGLSGPGWSLVLAPGWGLGPAGADGLRRLVSTPTAASPRRN